LLANIAKKRKFESANSQNRQNAYSW